MLLTLPIREVLPATPRARIVRVDVGHHEGEALQIDIEMRRDAERVVLPAVDRQKRFPLLGRCRELRG